MDSELNLIGPRLRQLREHRELSVEALAQRAGCSPNAGQREEAGQEEEQEPAHRAGQVRQRPTQRGEVDPEQGHPEQ